MIPKCLICLSMALICAVAYALFIIAWINIWWYLDEYMTISKQDVNGPHQLIATEEADPFHWGQGAEGDEERNPIIHQINFNQIVISDESGDH